MAKAMYLDKTKQDIYEDWRRFVKINFFPHTQTCTKCNAINKLENLTDIYTQRHDHRYFIFNCLGCGRSQEFTGGSHLPKTIQEDLSDKFSNATGRYEYSGFYEYDHPVVHSVTMMGLGAIGTMIIGLVLGAVFW